MEIDIEKLLKEVAETPNKIEKSLREIKKVRLESARKLHWWIIILTFLLGVAIGTLCVLFTVSSVTLNFKQNIEEDLTEKSCKSIGFELFHQKDGNTYCIKKLIPHAKQ